MRRRIVQRPLLSRRATAQDSDSGKEQDAIITSMEDLPESVLVSEVFSRINHPRDIAVCKTVCKQWNSLISEVRQDPAFALIINIPAAMDPASEPQPHYATKDKDRSLFKEWKGFKLEYLPCFRRGGGGPVCVQASCMDLLLCSKSYKLQQHLYVVNPVTMQWTGLPQKPNCGIFSSPVGLLADVCGSKYRYKVVLLTYGSNRDFGVTCYDSEIGHWCSSRVKHTPWTVSNWFPTHYQGVPFKGVLHWLAKDGPIVAYNPTDRFNCRLIHRSQEMRQGHHSGALVTECLTASAGHLRVLQLLVFPDDGFTHHLSLWSLVDYEKPAWERHHLIYFSDMVSDVPWLQDYMRRFAQVRSEHKMAEVTRFNKWLVHDFAEFPENKESDHRPEPLACHPSNPLLVYLHLPHSIVSLDLPTKKLEIISKISTQLESYWYDTALPFMVKLDPTPVHYLGQKRQGRGRVQKGQPIVKIRYRIFN